MYPTILRLAYRGLGALFSVSIVVAVRWRGLAGWEIYLVPLAALSLLLILNRPRVLFYVVLVLPLLIPEVSNDDLFLSTRTPFYAFKILGLVNPYDLLYLGMIAAWLFGRLRDGRIQCDRPLDVPLLGFILATIIGLMNGLWFHSEEHRLIFYEFINITRFAFMYFIAADYMREEKDSRRVLLLWLACAAGLGVWGVYRFLNGSGVDIYSQGQKLIFADPGFNTLLMVALLISVGMVSKRHTWRPQLTVSLMMVPVAFSLIFSYRRGVWLGLLAALGLLFLLTDHSQRKPMLKNLLLLLVLIIGFIFSLQKYQPKIGESLTFSLSRVKSIGTLNKDPSNVYRVIDIQNAWESIKHYPVFGIGLGGYYDIFYGSETNHAYQVARLNNVSHNSFLFYWMKMGFFSLVFFLWALAVVLKQARAGLVHLPAGFQRQLLIFSLAVFLGFIVIMVTGPLLLFAGGASIFGVLLAILTQPIRIAPVPEQP